MKVMNLRLHDLSGAPPHAPTPHPTEVGWFDAASVAPSRSNEAVACVGFPECVAASSHSSARACDSGARA